MFLYKVTNLINDKIYIGITNNYKRRWREHKTNHNPKSIIAKAIQKYGENNFKFEVLFQGLSLEESEEKEIEMIKKFNSLVPNGYNISKGGQITSGCNNGRALLTEEEVRYIKSNRNQPMYKLYEIFNEKISYEQFKKVYNNLTYLEIIPTVDVYPFNMEFGCQFNHGNFSLAEIEDIRSKYQQGIHWKEVYREYQQSCSKQRFWQIYTGRGYKYVMPEVFTEENKAKHKNKSSGSKNPNSKLNEEQVLDIRKMNKQGINNQEIYNKYPFVTPNTIRDIINRKTWKTLL